MYYMYYAPPIHPYGVAHIIAIAIIDGTRDAAVGCGMATLGLLPYAQMTDVD